MEMAMAMMTKMIIVYDDNNDLIAGLVVDSDSKTRFLDHNATLAINFDDDYDASVGGHDNCRSSVADLKITSPIA